MAERSGAGLRTSASATLLEDELGAFRGSVARPAAGAWLGLPAVCWHFAQARFMSNLAGSCLSTETVRVRQSAKIDIKLLCEQDGLNHNQAPAVPFTVGAVGEFRRKS